MTADYFTFLGLPQKLKIDAVELQKRFYELSRKWHPDRYGRASASDQQTALDSTALLNDAYRTLRDPVLRAEYLLERNGVDVNSSNVPPELLEEVFELNMAIEESDRSQLEESRVKFNAMLAETDSELAVASAAYDDGGPDALQSLRGILNRRKYVQNLVRDVNKALD